MLNVLRRAAPLLLLLVAVALFPLVARSHYLQQLGVLIGLYSMVTIGLSLLMGYAGQASLGQAAFFGLGAYASAVLSTKAGLNPWLAMLIGIAITCTVAALVGRPTLKLHGHYLAMATLGFGIIVQVFFHEAKPITEGFGGIASIPRLAIGGLVFKGDMLNFYLAWAGTAACLAVGLNVVESRVGRAMRAIHDSEIAASACGVDVARYKVQVFVLGAGFASLAGSIYAHYITFASPEPFGLMFSVQLLVMVIVGGARSLWGAVLGAALMTALGQQIEKIELIRDLSVLVYGTLLMLFVIFMPDGLAGLVRRGWGLLPWTGPGRDAHV